MNIRIQSMRNKSIAVIFLKRLIVYLSIASAGFLLAACSSVWQSTYEMTKVAFTNSDTIINQAKLDPKYRYLRFEANGRAVLLLHVFIDAHSNGPIEVWYGADPIMVRLQNGRYFGSQGLQVNWQDIVVDNVPNFTKIVTPQTYERVRQQEPGSKFNIHETVLLTPLTEMPAIAPKEWKERSADTASSIRWFSETVIDGVGSSISRDSSKIVAYYAVDMTSKPEVIFGYQCLKQGYCISWYAWPFTWLNKGHHGK